MKNCQTLRRTPGLSIKPVFHADCLLLSQAKVATAVNESCNETSNSMDGEFASTTNAVRQMALLSRLRR